jgi:hypothetical protein
MVAIITDKKHMTDLIVPADLLSFFEIMTKSKLPTVYLKHIYAWYMFVKKYDCSSDIDVGENFIKTHINTGTNRLGVGITLADNELLHIWHSGEYHTKFTLSGTCTYKFNFEDLFSSIAAKEKAYMKRLEEERLIYAYTPKLPPIRVSYQPTWCDNVEN